MHTSATPCEKGESPLMNVGLPTDKAIQRWYSLPVLELLDHQLTIFFLYQIKN